MSLTLSLEEMRQDIFEVCLSAMEWSYPSLGGREQVLVPKAAREVVREFVDAIPEAKVLTGRAYPAQKKVDELRRAAWEIQKARDEQAKHLHEALAD